MADRISREARSRNMANVKSKNTKPEMLIRKYLFSQGFRFRLHDKMLPGKPDIILPKYKTVIFVNGCFWHGHSNCKYFTIPKTRSEWWMEKINKNINNDSTAEIKLQELGWKVVKVWGCELKKSNIDHTLSGLLKQIKKFSGPII